MAGLAAARGLPLLVTEPEQLSAGTERYLERSTIRDVVAVGTEER